MLATLQPSLSTLVYRLVCAVLALVAAGSLALLMSGRAEAGPVVTGEFDVPGSPGHIAQGPDGNIWVLLDGSGGGGEDIARITPDGDVQGFDVPLLANGADITAGPGDTLWVTRPAKLARFSAGNPAGAEEFAVAGLGSPGEITLGPDGNLWAVPQNGDTLMRIPPGNPEGYTPFTILGMTARGITSDGERLWIASFGNGTVYSATTAGEPTPHVVGGNPQGIAAGLGGQVAYANPADEIGRLTFGGTPLTTPTPGADPFGVAFGADQAYWFAQFASNDLGRLTADGQYTTLSGFSAASGPRRITAGPGNTLWVSLEQAQKVARVSGLEPPAPAPPADDAIIRISGLKLVPKRFWVGRKPTAVSARKRGKAKRRVPVGSSIRFTLSRAGDVRITVERKLNGRRAGKRCVAPKRKLRGRKTCTRWVKTGRVLERKGLAAGAQKIAFSGRIGRKALAPGNYRLTVSATPTPGPRPYVAKSTRFTIVR